MMGVWGIMRAIQKTAVMLFSTAALYSGVAVVTAPTAAAYPQDCSAGTSSNSGWSYCRYGSGSHRVRVTCNNNLGSIYYRWGGWVGTGSYSTRACDSVYHKATGALVEKQGD